MDYLNLTPGDKAAMKKRWLEALHSLYSPEEVISLYRPEDIMRLFTQEDRLKGMRPEDRLKGITPEELEAYLLRMKREQAGKIPEDD